jgi:hypothetical protein
MEDNQEALRAHLGFDKALKGLRTELRGTRPPELPFTPLRLLEHMRIAQWDILEFSRDPKRISPDWPETEAPPDAREWNAIGKTFKSNLQEMEDLVADPIPEVAVIGEKNIRPRELAEAVGRHSACSSIRCSPRRGRRSCWVSTGTHDR